MLKSGLSMILESHMTITASQFTTKPCCFFNSLFMVTTKETSRLCITGLLLWVYIGNWWIPLTKGQSCSKNFHVMMLSQTMMNTISSIQLYSSATGGFQFPLSILPSNVPHHGYKNIPGVFSFYRLPTQEVPAFIMLPLPANSTNVHQFLWQV